MIEARVNAIFHGEVVDCGACKGEGLSRYDGRDPDGAVRPNLCVSCKGTGKRVVPISSHGFPSAVMRRLLSKRKGG